MAMNLPELPWLLLVAMVLVLIRGPSHLAACGSSSSADLGVLRSVDGLVADMRYPEGPWALWGNEEREALRFLYPYWDDDPAGMDVLWRFSHDNLMSVPAPSTQALDDAIAMADWTAASAAARDVVDSVLELPPVLAAAHGDVLDRAVEVVELEPHLWAVPADVARDYLARREASSWSAALLRAHEARTQPEAATLAGHPREATLGWLALNRDFSATVPDGWSDAARKLPSGTWRRLLGDTETWLQANPTHPLRDLVSLHRVRIHYFAGTTDAAWKILVGLVARRPVRALAEMRYLLVMGHPPSDAQIDALTDPVLITALAVPERINASRWRRWWKLSETAPEASWSHHLQERLLLSAALTGAPLSPAFPQLRQPPTPLWGKTRAAALIKAGLPAAANAQLALVPSDREQGRLAAHAWLKRNRRVDAASLVALDDDTRRYIVEILMSDAELRQLTRVPAVATHARLELAIRATGEGRWEAAASAIEADDPTRAALWRRAHALALDRSDDAPVRLARLFAEHRATIFYPIDYGWYRGLSYRREELRTSGRGRGEVVPLTRHLTRSSANWRALVLLTGWLERHPDDPAAREVLSEADAHYNRLINQGGSTEFFWGAYTASAPEVAALRRVGATIRASAKDP